MSKKSLGNNSLFFGALLSFIISLHQAGWKVYPQGLGWEVWIIVPYFLCWLLSRPLYKSANQKLATVSAAFSLLVLLFSVMVYGSFYYGRQSSTGSLAFIFVPLYLTIATVLVLGVANILRIFQGRGANVAA